MSDPWMIEALEVSGLPPSPRFPRDLADEAELHLQVTTEELPGLSISAVRSRLRQRGVRVDVSDTDRAVHGCLVAVGAGGFVFLDSADGEAERRFTLAHEIAHFVLNHLIPRARVLEVFGDQIRSVLDCERAPTREERLSAVLARVPLGVQVHLLSRGPDGAVCTWDVEESEQQADRFALELLAPAHAARASLQSALGDVEDPWDPRHDERAAEHLAEGFGVPASVARSYVPLLLGGRRRRTLIEELFGRR